MDSINFSTEFLNEEPELGNSTTKGGAIDTQMTLPFGSPEDVRKEKLEKCEIFSKEGGFVFTSIHNIQANTPVKNIAALISAVKDFNGTI